MSKRTRLVPQLADLTYTHTLLIESTHEYKVHMAHGPFIHEYFKWPEHEHRLGHMSGFLRHYLLIPKPMKFIVYITVLKPYIRAKYCTIGPKIACRQVIVILLYSSYKLINPVKQTSMANFENVRNVLLNSIKCPMPLDNLIWYFKSCTAYINVI